MPTHAAEFNPYNTTAARKHMIGEIPRPKTVTVDLHNHMRIPEAAEFIQPHMAENSNTSFKFSSDKTKEIYKKQFDVRPAGWSNAEARIKDMDKMHLDVMAVSCMPAQMYYKVDPIVGQEAAQVVNDGIYTRISPHPKRFVGIGTVPMQNTDMALKEIDRCVNELGFRGIQIAARVDEDELSAERFEPIWSKCEELSIVVFVHPRSFASPRFERHYMTNVIGNPLDTTTAIHNLIFDGVLARYPKIKFYMSHGGAFASHYAARMDHAYGARADCREHIYELPSTYLKRLYFDTIVFAVDQLEFLVRKYGADHIALGTDYPADMAEYDPVEHVCQSEEITEADREKICGLNALRLMGLDAADFQR